VEQLSVEWAEFKNKTLFYFLFNMICIKLHKSYRNVLAVCDSNLIGRKFEQDNLQLDCRESFYKEKEITYKEAVELMKSQLKEDATFNMVGQDSIKAAQEAEIINPKNVRTVNKIPFILVLL